MGIENHGHEDNNAMKIRKNKRLVRSPRQWGACLHLKFKISRVTIMKACWFTSQQLGSSGHIAFCQPPRDWNVEMPRSHGDLRDDNLD